MARWILYIYTEYPENAGGSNLLLRELKEIIPTRDAKNKGRGIEKRFNFFKLKQKADTKI